MKEFRITSLKPVEYSGFHQELVKEPALGLNTRLIALDYSGECEVFVRNCHLFERIERMMPEHIQSVAVAEGRKPSEYTGLNVSGLINDINEKVLQWISFVPEIHASSSRFEKEISDSPGSRFEFYEPTRFLESQIEYYCFKLISILDVYAKLASVFNRDSPQKFGQQIASTRNGRLWDQGYQDFIMNLSALIELRDYRNALGHVVSLKLRPARINGGWIAVLVKNYHDMEGYCLCNFLLSLQTEMTHYIDFFDNYYAGKAAYLDIFMINNKL